MSVCCRGFIKRIPYPQNDDSIIGESSNFSVSIVFSDKSDIIDLNEGSRIRSNSSE